MRRHHLDLVQGAPQLAPRLLSRFDRDQLDTGARERAGDDAGAGVQLEHRTRLPIPAGTTATQQVRDPAERGAWVWRAGPTEPARTRERPQDRRPQSSQTSSP